jgi:hypothetical protein
MPSKRRSDEAQEDAMNTDEREQLELLIEESQLSDFDRRGRRMIAAEAAIKAAGGSIADALNKARLRKQLTDDEFVLSHLGFTRREWENGEPNRELERRGRVNL